MVSSKTGRPAAGEASNRAARFKKFVLVTVHASAGRQIGGGIVGVDGVLSGRLVVRVATIFDIQWKPRELSVNVGLVKHHTGQILPSDNAYGFRSGCWLEVPQLAKAVEWEWL